MRFLTVLLVIVGSLLATSGLAQAPEQAPAQPQEPVVLKPELIGQATMAGARFYRPGSWGMIGANVANPTDEAAELFFTSWVQPGVDTQYARRVWLPAKSRMRVTHPLYVPTNARLGTNGTGEIETLLIDEKSGTETRAGRGSNLLLFNTVRPSTAHISDPMDDRPGAVVVAARLSRGFRPTTSPMRPEELPTEAAALDVVDVMIISHRAPGFDADQLASLRGWLNAGGRLWIMLDRVDPEFGRQLLMDDWGIDVVGDASVTTTAIRSRTLTPDASGRYAMRVGLFADGSLTFDGNPVASVDDMRDAVARTVFQLKSRDPMDMGRRVQLTVEPDVAPMLVARASQTIFDAGGRIGETVRVTDQPVAFRRVIADGMETLFSVTGWPVAMRRSVGRGEVYVTTIEPDALRTGRDGALPPLRQLAVMMLEESPRAVLPPQRFSPYISSQIGYQIAGRGTVAMLLLGLVGTMIVGAVVLMKLKRLEWLAPLGAVAASVVTIGFVFLGIASRKTQPLTMASGGLVQVVGGQQASYSGKLTVYSPEPIALDLRGELGGVSLPDGDNLSADVKRLVWSDRHRWAWSGLKLRSGDAKSAVVYTDVPLSKPVVASFTFDENGATGVVDGSAMSGFEPQFLVYQMLHTRITRGANYQARVKPDDLLAVNDFSAGALQDASAAAKQTIADQLVSAGGLPDMPMVVGWSDRTEVGTTVSGLSENRGASLVTIPVTIVPPDANAMVTVPAVFVSLEAARPPEGGSMRAIFGMGTHGWPKEVTDSQAFSVRFKPPVEVMPLIASRATLILDSRAPSQQLTITAYDGLTKKTVQTINSPSGTQTIVIDDPALLKLDEEGGIVLTFQFTGINTGVGEQPKWRVENMGLALQGKARATTTD